MVVDFAEDESITGYPDGMTIDTEGMLWVASYFGGKIYRFNPGTGIYVYREWLI